MSFQKIEFNILQIEEIIKKIDELSFKKKFASSEEKRSYDSSISSLYKQAIILNSAIASLITEIGPAKPLQQTKNSSVPSYDYLGKKVSLKKGDEKEYIKEISKEKIESSRAISRTLFFNFASKNAAKFEELKKDLNSANMQILVQNYVSLMFFYSLVSFFLGIILGATLFYLTANIIFLFVLPLFFPLSVFIGIYSYPALTKGSLLKQMNEELPFATIYMSAVASSDLEPTKMFRLLASSKEYPSIGIEMKKVVNQIDLYGYNLATALRNVAQNSVSGKVSELFSGLATNITSGGSLKNYLEKKAENYLVDYRLERQQYISVAETFMDIYISVLITAPLILMIIFVIMSMTGFNTGLSITAINLLIIGLVTILNFIFLAILQVKQPKN